MINVSVLTPITKATISALLVTRGVTHANQERHVSSATLREIGRCETENASARWTTFLSTLFASLVGTLSPTASPAPPQQPAPSARKATSWMAVTTAWRRSRVA